MAIKRQLPNTDVGRNSALVAAKNKKDNSLPANIVFTQKTIQWLDTTQPVLTAAIQARGNALAAQATATQLKKTAQERTQMFISHFIQTFNNAVDRGVYPPSHRAFYQLDVNSNSVPEMKSEALIHLWGENIISGDAVRMAAGGTPPMSMPTIAEVTTQCNHFKTVGSAHSTAKDAYEKAQETVSKMREDVDNLILRMWDEVETAFNDEEASGKRRRAREWGVVYVSTQRRSIIGRVTSAVTGKPLSTVLVTLVETESSIQTNADGTYVLHTNFTGHGNLEFVLAGYITQTIGVYVSEGDILTQDVSLQAIA